MNTSKILTIATLALTATFAVHANDSDPLGARALRTESTRTRAAVQAEAIAAMQARATSRFSEEIGYAPSAATMVTSTLTRAEVAQQAYDAARNGSLALEPSGARCVC